MSELRRLDLNNDEMVPHSEGDYTHYDEAEAALKADMKLINHQVMKIARMATELAERGVRIEKLETENQTAWNKVDDLEVAESRCKARIAELEAQVPEWIDVRDESFPDDDRNVHCFDGDDVFVGFYSHVDLPYIKPGWCDYDGNEVDEPVTHWMPLPSVPKGKA